MCNILHVDDHKLTEAGTAKFFVKKDGETIIDSGLVTAGEVRLFRPFYKIIGRNSQTVIQKGRCGMGKQDELRMTYSGLLMKDEEKMVRVCFERGESDYAEGIVPRGKIVKSQGFTEEEVDQLEIYLQEQATDIIHRAKDVNFLKEWLGK